MAEYDSSKLSLINGSPVSGTEHLSEKDVWKLEKPKYWAKSKDSGKRWIMCGFIVMSFLFVVVFGVIVLGAVYIQQMQHTISRLEDRDKKFEKEFSNSPCQDPGTLESSVSNTNSKIRYKRSENDLNESPHIRMEHHGISSANIALLYGNASVIKQNASESNTYGQSNYRFTRMRSQNENNNCEIWYKRKDDQQFCTKLSEGTSYDKYRTSGSDEKYYYFNKASWMSRSDSINNFIVSNDGAIKVLKSGIYIVQASVHFVKLREDGGGTTANYKIYKTDEVHVPTLVAQCKVTVFANSDGIYPCLSWQLVSLKKDEIIYISIECCNWFSVDKETLHFALIKLNGERID